ncbi:MAG: Asp23/Gls24 family envelope stress response protein [Oscillospiraceae bacterium]|nr:Asp23/Gls24 family envelope stress response protein [Oscillospiraceae bacterium]
MGDNKGYIKRTDEKGSVNISGDVIAVIAANASMEVEGVHGLFASHGKEITNKIARKTASKGVKIQVNDDDEISLDIQIVTEAGVSINEVGARVQDAVKLAVEKAAGLTVGAVHVHVCGTALKKDK